MAEGPSDSCDGRLGPPPETLVAFLLTATPVGRTASDNQLGQDNLDVIMNLKGLRRM